MENQRETPNQMAQVQGFRVLHTGSKIVGEQQDFSRDHGPDPEYDPLLGYGGIFKSLSVSGKQMGKILQESLYAQHLKSLIDRGVVFDPIHNVFPEIPEPSPKQMRGVGISWSYNDEAPAFGQHLHFKMPDRREYENRLEQIQTDERAYKNPPQLQHGPPSRNFPRIGQRR